MSSPSDEHDIVRVSDDYQRAWLRWPGGTHVFTTGACREQSTYSSPARSTCRVIEALASRHADRRRQRSTRRGDPRPPQADDQRLGNGGIQGVRRFYETLAAYVGGGLTSATAIQTVTAKGHDGFVLAVVSDTA